MNKVYLLAELTIRPGFLEEVKAILKEALIPTLQVNTYPAPHSVRM